jgi:hypothetical protein
MVWGFLAREGQPEVRQRILQPVQAPEPVGLVIIDEELSQLVERRLVGLGRGPLITGDLADALLEQSFGLAPPPPRGSARPRATLSAKRVDAMIEELSGATFWSEDRVA